MLVAEGHRVIGITMRLYDASGTLAASGRCCGPRDIEDARRVCQHLDIPFYVVDFEADFTDRVIEDFVDSYLAGETPNPCVKCNQYIKFTPLLRRARALGADTLVTGHYARLDREDDGSVSLRRGLDPGKDQSYFLFSMPREELAAIQFPLGGLGKGEVRELAAELDLPNARKPESQEICFVPDGDYAGFVERRALTRKRAVPPPGDFVSVDGRVVGQHRGVHRYTIGQRRGLGNLDTGGEIVYVTAIDREGNRVVVGPKVEAERGALEVRDMHWLIEPPREGFRAAVQVRHRAQPIPCTVIPGANGRVAIELDEVRTVAAAGQAAVVYDGDRVLGGGWISR
jgi:tRNA-specific 2-thiouridylase